MPEEWDSSSEEESSSEESSSEESFDDEASDSESESESEEDSSEYSSDSGADESMESMDEVEGFGDEERGSRGSFFNEPKPKPKWAKFVPNKIANKGTTYSAIFCFCICFIPLALIIGLSVGLTVGRGGDDEETRAPTPTISPNATPPPMAALTEAPTVGEVLIQATRLPAEASNTIYRVGSNREVSAGQAGVMLVQNALGDTELDSAYSLVEFDGILGDGTTLSVDEYLDSIQDLSVEFCLFVAQGAGEEQTYSTCLLSPENATDIATLTGATAPAYSIPTDCLNDKVVTFSVLPNTTEVCVDIGPLLTEASNLRGRRRMEGANANYLLMIDALEVSDTRGTSFYSSVDIQGRAPTLTVQGTNTILPAADNELSCTPTGTSVLDVLLADTDSFSSVASFVQLAGLVDPLVCLPNITLFAPDNDAFAQLTQRSPVLVQLLQSAYFKLHLQNLLEYHLVPEELSSADITTGLTAPTVSGDSLEFLVNKHNKIFVNNETRVDSADLDASNGVVHLIEAVLLPSWVNKNIADVIAETPALATINDFIKQANLASLLSQPASPETVYTVFAPTNEAIQGALAAFAGIGITETETLTAILQQHIVPGVYSASALESVDILTSASGTNLTFVTEGGSTTVGGYNIVPDLSSNNGFVNTIETAGGYNIVSSDILANNGIVHLIDGVLLPPSLLAGGTMPGGMVVGDGPTISMPTGGGMGAASQSCSICTGEAGTYTLASPNSTITIPDGITITNIPKIGEVTCTLLEQTCQFGFCDSSTCAALAAGGASDTCGCQLNE